MRLFLNILMVIFCLLTSSVYAEEEKSTGLTFDTTGFLDANMIPVIYTCDGKDISPELSWSNVPSKAQTFAIILNDPSAPNGNFYHWIVYNIPKSVAKFDEGMQKLPTGAQLGKNDFGKTAYNGPCPPKGTSHSYIYTLYVLDTKLNLPAGADG